MSAHRSLNELAARRQVLVLEAELHRSLIALECEQLRARMAHLRSARERLFANKPLLIAGSAATGLLAFRHWRRILRWLPLALSAFRWLRSRKAE